VNIPLGELAKRTHELPPLAQVIPVAADRCLFEQTAAELARLGRRCIHVPAYTCCSPHSPRYGRLWRPNAYLERIALQCAPGRALDLGCGTGRDTVYLAAQGWFVTGVDHLPDAIERGRARARVSGVAENRIEWVVSDAAAYVSSHTGRFDLIAMIRFLDIGVLRALPRLLNSGGSVICVMFAGKAPDAGRASRGGRPEIGASTLRSLLGGWIIRELAHDADERGREVIQLHATSAE
jgi:SAM-dependent methyltransferase